MAKMKVKTITVSTVRNVNKVKSPDPLAEVQSKAQLWEMFWTFIKKLNIYLSCH